MSSNNPKILLVKLSSLGDVLHNLPLVWDLRAKLPEAQIDWIVEEGYVGLLEPLRSREGFRGIDRIIPIAFRRWKHSLGYESLQEFLAAKKQLRQCTYDVVIETQGLLKSALVCTLAKKSPKAIVAGLDNATEYSGYEPLARSFYNHCVQVPKRSHAVDRSRVVMSSALGWPLIHRTVNPPRFYPEEFTSQLGMTEASVQKNRFQLPYILCFHSTARAAKLWSLDHWAVLGRALSAKGYQLVFPWGNASEKKRSEELALQIAGALVPDAFSIQEAFSIIAGASLTIGVDTGLTHLAAVLGRPTVEIYCDSPKWKTEGYWSERIRNLGDRQEPPDSQEVLDAALTVLDQARLNAAGN